MMLRSRYCFAATGSIRHYSTQLNKARVIKTDFTNHSTTVTFAVQKKSKHDDLKDEQYTVSFDNLFLRDASRSNRSIDSVSGQRLFTTGELLLNKAATTPVSVELLNDNQNVLINWKDGDSYAYPVEFFYKYKGSSFLTDSLRQIFAKNKPVLWDQSILKPHLKGLTDVKYNDYANKDETLYQVLVNLQKYGLCLIADIPKDLPDALTNISNRIGPIRKTLYGETFEVEGSASSEQQSQNIAYSSLPLPLHMDLQYLENVPGWQLLNCVKDNTKTENTFVDAFHVIRTIRENDAPAYEGLQMVPINYQYSNGDNRYFQSRPLFEQYESNEFNSLENNFEYLIKSAHYSPMFQAPFSFGIYGKNSVSTMPSKLTQRLLFTEFKRGLALFEERINKPTNQFKLKLPENSCIIFNNRRILHGRSPAGPNTDRLLKGCYIDDDIFKSKLKFLEERYNL